MDGVVNATFLQCVSVQAINSWGSLTVVEDITPQSVGTKCREITTENPWLGIGNSCYLTAETTAMPWLPLVLVFPQNSYHRTERRGSVPEG